MHKICPQLTDVMHTEVGAPLQAGKLGVYKLALIHGSE